LELAVTHHDIEAIEARMRFDAEMNSGEFGSGALDTSLSAASKSVCDCGEEAEALARQFGNVIGENGPDEQFEVTFTLGRLEALIRKVRHEDWIASFPPMPPEQTADREEFHRWVREIATGPTPTAEDAHRAEAAMWIGSGPDLDAADRNASEAKGTK
jgi:hypothetical protein